MFNVEDYEVVDECMEEDEEISMNRTQVESTENSVKPIENNSSESSNNVREKPANNINRELPDCTSNSIENTMQKQETEHMNNLGGNQSDGKESAEDLKQSIPSMKDNYPRPMEDNSIDFTADITLDQLDDQKEMTDEDVMQHLDEIENIVLDPEAFRIQNENEQECVESKISQAQTEHPSKDLEKSEHSEKKLDQSSIVVKEEPQPDSDVNESIKIEKNVENNSGNDWYEKKLAEKEATIRERLKKLARVLEFSYPAYQKWLEHAEKISGSPICKLEPARRCPLNKPYTNRWKFICSRKCVQESTKEADTADASVNKNVETVWRLEPTGAWGVNINNDSEFPPFVLRAVKIFEDFLQTTEQSVAQESLNSTENFTDDVSIELDQKKEVIPEGKQQWLWLLVRCNSMDELMLFATGKNINRYTMDRLKQVYESGPGKDCNVKSLYCKSVNKCDDAIVTNTTFLVGSEALDEIVGGLKVQLAPKTNFWSNAGGAENVAKAAADLLAPNLKTTVLEIGCGIGLIGLMLASKCQQIIGVDSQSEVEEAEMTCELNNIKNASFIMGSPSEVTTKITSAVKNSKTFAVINANTNIGRALEVMSCLRKINSLRRLVMITTLTKQSVRAILELARPFDRNIGHPFMPVRACVVDTLPVGPHFEVIILMERRLIHKLPQPWQKKPTSDEVKTASSTSAEVTHVKANEQNSNTTDKKSVPVKVQESQKKGTDKVQLKSPGKKGKPPVAKKIPEKNIDNVPSKGKFKGKRAHSPDRSEVPPKKFIKKPNKFQPWRAESNVQTKKKKDWVEETPQLRINPLYEKKIRENKDQADLRERLSSNRVDSEIAQKVKEHQTLLKIAKEKLSGPAVDVTTAKQLQNMLNMVLEQTNKLQNQLPRSVWDRIAPPENVERLASKDVPDDALLKGRYVQEMGSQDILITTANKKFLEHEEPEQKPGFRKYNNLPPLEPNLIMPVSQPDAKPEPDRYHGSDFRKQQNQGNSWNRDKMFEKNRWPDAGNVRKPISPMRRQMSPMKHRLSPPPRRFSPKRPLLSPPRRLCSPPRKHLSPPHRPCSPFRPRDSLMRRELSPPRRLMSPVRRPMSPPRRQMPLAGGRPISPPRRQMSPPRRPMPLMRQQMSPIRRQMSPPRRQMSPPGRMMTSPRRDIQPPRRQMMPQEREHVSPMRRDRSPHRIASARPLSPPRRQQSPPRRPLSPLRRFATDEWDIPSRGAVEQNIWSRSTDRVQEKTWREERQPTSSTSWDQSSSNDRYGKLVNQDKWDIKDSSRGGTWRSGGGDTWTAKQPSVKPVMKEQWSQGSEKRWTDVSHSGPSGDNWNIRGKESSFSGRDEPWMESSKPRWETSQPKDTWTNQGQEDWNDLPEDARDPWGDDANLGVKDRWSKFDNSVSSSTWVRESDKGDSWQSKGQQHVMKSQWQGISAGSGGGGGVSGGISGGGGGSGRNSGGGSNSGNQNMVESRWMSQSDIGKKYPSMSSSNWQSSSGSGSWQSQSYSYSQQRPFSSSQFKPSKLI